ncbi:hypothetical protein FIBSPDRAFT_944909 [Athelia psychrophila]|uniref:Uncharacterized protein n=1 Tax=Athelia psychrophila TaxID=1759441 RepID=A0A166UMS3_9AGAM|nr:hypothetical protein FIBSPDRAFT_944909 [Fibularhizoctonia sp. CBS 109695]
MPRMSCDGLRVTLFRCRRGSRPGECSPASTGQTNNLTHPAVAQLCINFYYGASSRIGHEYETIFGTEVPPLAVALGIVVIKCCLDEYTQGKKKNVPFQADMYRTQYEGLVKSVDTVLASAVHGAKFLRARREWASSGLARVAEGPVVEEFCFQSCCLWLIEHAYPSLKVSIIPRGVGARLGYAQYLLPDRYLLSTPQIIDHICTTLGGRISEEVFFGAANVTTGAQDDLQGITNMAFEACANYGLNSVIGPVSYGGQKDSQEAYTKRRPVAELLLEKEVFTREDMLSMLGRRPFKGESERWLDENQRKSALPPLEKMPGPALDPAPSVANQAIRFQAPCPIYNASL